MYITHFVCVLLDFRGEYFVQFDQPVESPGWLTSRLTLVSARTRSAICVSASKTARMRLGRVIGRLGCSATRLWGAHVSIDFHNEISIWGYRCRIIFLQSDR